MSNFLYREKRPTCGNNLLICLQSAIGWHWPPLLITNAHRISHKGYALMQRKQMVWDQSTWQPHKYVISLACPKDPKLLTMFIPQPHKLTSCWIKTVSVRWWWERQAMPGSTLTGAFVDSSFNIYTKAVVTFTSRNNTSNNRHVQNIYTQWSSWHVLFIQLYDTTWSHMQTLYW